MPTYLADILASHRARAAADRRPLGDLVEQAASAPPPRDFAGALRVGRALVHRRDQASLARPRATSTPGSSPTSWPRSTLAGGAACLSVLTDADFFGGSADDLAVGAPGLRPARAAQGLHGAAGRRRRRPPHGRRRGAPDRRRPRRRRAARLRGPRRAARPGRARRGARRGGARPRAGGRVVPGRGEPARPAHVPGRSRARRAPWRHASRPGSSPSPSRASGTPPTPGGWPRPATTPSWWARRWCGRRTGWASSRSWSVIPSGRDDRRTSSSRSAASPRRPTRCWRSASGPRPSGSSSPPRRGRSRCSWRATSPSGSPSTC